MALTLACNNPPNGTTSTPYSHQMTLSGGTAPYVVTVDSGSLPPGLSISNTALITGIPTTAGTYPFTIGAVDSVTALDLLSPKTDWFSGYDWSAENPSLPGISVDGDWIKVTPNPGLVPAVLALKDYTTPLDTTNGGTADPNDTISIKVKCSDWSKMLWLDLTIFTDHSAFGAKFFDYALYASGGAFDGLAPGDTLTITTKRSDWSASLGADWASVTRLDVFPVLTTADATAWFKDFTVSAGQNAQVNCSITVETPPIPDVVLECNTPPQGSVGISYHHHMTLSGGLAPYTVSISSGALPTGLTISNQAIINGTPTTVGTFNFDVTATDALLTSKTVSCSIEVVSPALTLECASPPSGTVGHAYTHQMLLVGGTAPYTVSATGLPAGLSIDNNGLITGTPTTAGVSSFTATATDSSGGGDPTPAAPVTSLFPNRDVGYDGNSAGRGHPFQEYDGALYSFLSTTTGPAASGFGIHALKSTDDGANWTEVDSSNAPVFNASCTLPSYVVGRDGDTIIVLGVKWTGTDFTNWTFNEWESWTFDLATETWSERAVVTGPNPVRLTAGGVAVGLYLSVRGTGDYLLICSTGNAQFSYATFDGSAIGPWIALPAGYVTGVAVDSSGRTYVIRKSGSTDFYCDVILANASLQSPPVTIKSSTATLLGGYWDDFSDAITYTRDGTEKVAFIVNEWREGTDYGMRMYSATVGATPTFAPSDIDNTGVGNDGQTLGGYLVAGGVALAYANGALVAVWQHADDVAYDLSEFVYSVSVDGGSTWSAPATLAAQSVAQSYYAPAQAWAAPITAGVGVVLSFQNGHSGPGQGNDEAQYALIGVSTDSPATDSVTCSITILNVATTTQAIHNVWESGYIRLPNEGPKLARLGNADLWIRGDGPLIHTWKGLDGTPSVTPQLKVGSVAVTDMSATPGLVYEAKSDLKSENYTMRFETDAVDAYFELSSFTAFWRPDKYVR